MPLNELRATEWAAPPAGPLGSTKNGGRETTQTAGGGNPTLYRRGGKRLLDTALAATGLLLASPLLLICGAAIWLDSPGRIFFRQRRVGQGGKPFDIVKFRTMVERAEQMGSRLTAGGDSRVTRVGKWLRKTKLDELPQLFNILKGEMSLVGPRPEVPEYVAAYNEEQIRVLDLGRPINVVRQVAVLVQIERLSRHAAGRRDQEADKEDTPRGDWPAHRISVLGVGQAFLPAMWSRLSVCQNRSGRKRPARLLAGLPPGGGSFQLFSGPPDQVPRLSSACALRKREFGRHVIDCLIVRLSRIGKVEQNCLDDARSCAIAVSSMPGVDGLLWWQADGTVEADDCAVEHGVFDDLLHELGELVGATKAEWEESLGR